jgi:heme/copper-type cytochrome/quinol oxidase subunit 2
LPFPRAIRVRARQITLKGNGTLRVTSGDVTHGFFSRQLKIGTDLAPGQTAEVPLTPAAAGTYTIICDHFCGPARKHEAHGGGG